LAPSSESVKLCRAFAGQLGKTLNPFEAFPEHFAKGLRNIPVISNATSVLYCETVKVFKVQDHEIWVAAVKDILGTDGERQGSLFYQNHQFHALGPPIE
jgi:flavin reductase (DIM6/NTAB) family NADH-FMN oxidoreductase RutF